MNKTFLSVATVLALTAQHASAITTSLGATWDTEPDAWARGNDADTSWFGWDDLTPADEESLGFGRIFDDSTPDIGTAITATGTRAYQGTDGLSNPAPTTYGHVSGSNNYYSGSDASDETFTATAPASGAGGFTTVVLQVIGQGGGLTDLTFAMDNTVDAWTKQKDLYGVDAAGKAVFWQEWTAPGAGLTFSIDMGAASGHRAIDAFQIDSHWSAGGPVISSRSSIGVPEPATLALVGLAGGGALIQRRRRR